MRQIFAQLLAAVLLFAPAARAETIVVRTNWEKAQAMLAQDDFLSSIRVELQSGKRLKGKLIGATDEALRIERKKMEMAITREDIRAIRLVPRKAAYTKNRILAIAGGGAAGFGGGTLAFLYCCGEDRPGNESESFGNVIFFGTWAAIQVLTYRIGLRVDRGAVLLELTEAVADAPPSPAPLPAEQTSSAEEQQQQEPKATPQGGRR